MLLLIDNYDSFTWNLVHYLGELGAEAHVVRNDQITVQDALALGARGPSCSRPAPATRRRRASAWRLPAPPPARACRFWGCASATRPSARPSGGTVRRHSEIVHGKMGEIHHQGARASSPACLRRWNGDPRYPIRWWSTVPPCPTCWMVTAELSDGTIMGLRHRTLAIDGRAVPPRKHPVRAWARDAEEFPRHGAVRQESRPPHDRRDEAADLRRLRGAAVRARRPRPRSAELFEGTATPAQIGGLLMAMRAARRIRRGSTPPPPR